MCMLLDGRWKYCIFVGLLILIIFLVRILGFGVGDDFEFLFVLRIMFIVRCWFGNLFLNFGF